MLDAPFTEVKLTQIFTPQVPGRINIRAGGTYAVLVEAIISPEGQEYLQDLATPLLAACERTTHGTTDLAMYGLSLANRLRHADDPRAQEILAALEGDPKTWFTRVSKP